MYILPFKTIRTLDDALIIEELALLGINYASIQFQRIEIVTPFNYE